VPKRWRSSAGVLEVGVALGHEQHAAIARERVVDGLHRAVAGQEQRQRHVREDDELAQRDDGQLVGQLDRVGGVGHVLVSSRGAGGLRLEMRDRARSPTSSAPMAPPRRPTPAGRPPPLATGALRLPGWVRGFLRRQPARFAGAPARMRLAIALAAENARRGTGGPFGAAVFERASGRLVAVGVNRVEPSGCSHAHAEMLAIALAQRAVGGWDLGAPGLPRHELVSSSEPCAMCFGAIPWSGVRALVCGARAADAEAIGFDEGPKPARWAAALERRGIAVTRDVLRDEARAVLAGYAAAGRTIYAPARSPG
jgi:tRNA(Arg) A34 adenosine deaminase TadA